MLTSTRFRFFVPAFLVLGAASSLAGCEDKAATAERQAFIKTMVDGANEMCNCKDIACVEKANKKIQDAKNPSTPPTPEEVKQLDDATKKITDCQGKLTETVAKQAEKDAMKEIEKAAASAAPAAAPADSAAPAASAVPAAEH